ncbi:hypothetical protein BJ165DRAFT_1482125 [Panaeolus papilionaceus]|nr:hypothetical protein BJ165DRAFT_1482125 [Panaeolus papilionaceus]
MLSLAEETCLNIGDRFRVVTACNAAATVTGIVQPHNKHNSERRVNSDNLNNTNRPNQNSSTNTTGGMAAAKGTGNPVNTPGNRRQVTDAESATKYLKMVGVIHPDKEYDLGTFAIALDTVANNLNSDENTPAIKAISILLQEMKPVRKEEEEGKEKEMLQTVANTFREAKEDWRVMMQEAWEGIDSKMKQHEENMEKKMKGIFDAERKQLLDDIQETVHQSQFSTPRRTGEKDSYAGATARGGWEGSGAEAKGGEVMRPGEAALKAKTSKRQIMLEKTKGMKEWGMDTLTPGEIVMKVNIGINRAKQDRTDAKGVKNIIAARKLPRGGVLLTAADEPTAKWIKEVATKDFLDNIGGSTSVVKKGYNLAMDYVPVSLNPSSEATCREIERENNLKEGAIINARWFKNPDNRRQGQKAAGMLLTVKRARQANMIIRKGIMIDFNMIFGRRMEINPRTCYKCQEVGAEHTAAECPGEQICGTCGGEHHYAECVNGDKEYWYCRNCDQEGHGPADKACPAYTAAKAKLDARHPGNTQVLFDETDDESEDKEREQTVKIREARKPKSTRGEKREEPAKGPRLETGGGNRGGNMGDKHKTKPVGGQVPRSGSHKGTRSILVSDSDESEVEEMPHTLRYLDTNTDTLNRYVVV